MFGGSRTRRASVGSVVTHEELRPKPRRCRSIGGVADLADLLDIEGSTIGLRVVSKSVFKAGVIQTTTWTPEVLCFSLDVFLRAFKLAIVKHLEDNAEAPLNRKAYVDVSLTYVNAKDPADKKKIVLRTKTVRIVPGTNLNEAISGLMQQIENRNISFIRNKSGVVIESVDLGSLHVGKMSSFRGASYAELPDMLKRKKAVVNVKNKDNRCFGYAILSCRHYDVAYPKWRNNPEQYDKHFDAQLRQLNYPVKISDLEEVEKKLSQPINVLSFFDDKGHGMYSVYHSKLDPDTAINLLYWNGHFAWISNFERLMSGVSKHNGKKHFCMRCFCHFSCPDVLKSHKEICTGETCQQQLTMAPEGSTLKFRNVRYQQTCPFIIYADFECLTTEVDPNTEEPATGPVFDAIPGQAYQKHVPCSVGVLLVSTLPQLNIPYEQYVGKDSVSWFLTRLCEIESMCLEVLFSEARLIMDERTTAEFAAAKECYICGKEFGPSTTKVRDHDHVTGRYRGAAHQSCNLKLRTQYKIPIFIHNFRGYDSHLIVTSLGKFRIRKIDIIGQGMEKYLTLSFGDHLVFKDSLQFMADSLESLVKSLVLSGKDKFKHLRKGFGYMSEAEVDLMLRKGVYPYDYMNSWERFGEQNLPDINNFDSRLRAEKCSEEDYAHAGEMWTHFRCKTMKDYHDLYLKTDVLLLADVFENFREVCMEAYQLDPAHYLSAPQLSWDAMMKMTECELQLLSDSEMYRMLNNSLRGGISMITGRYARANNPRLGLEYNPTEEEKHLLYWDANNLYGWAMSQHLPYGGFRWMKEPEFSAINWMVLKSKSPTGYFVECDLDYPEELHDAHNDYPLAPERLKVESEMLSDKQHQIHALYTFNRSSAYSKLVPNLFPKKKYCLHYRNLKFYLTHGMILRKVHRVIEFQQEPWMKKYIVYNQDRRALAKCLFQQNFFKGGNNHTYGKTIENQSKRTNIKLVTDEVKAAELMALPHVLGFKVFTEDLAAVNLMKTRCVINRPFYVGFAVLELSKLHMYEFHYDFVKQRWPGDLSRLLFTDTDSLMYEIRASNVYATIWDNRELFDLADYPSDFYHDPANKKVIGKFKDETSAKPILEFVGLRPKMYSFTTLRDAESTSVVEKTRAKGIQRAALKRLRHDDYLRQLKTPAENKITNRRIGSKLHRLYTYEFAKRALCAFDDKRFIQPDGITTLAYGHWRLKGSQQPPSDSVEAPLKITEYAQAVAEKVLPMEVEPLSPGLDPEQVVTELRRRRLDAAFANNPPENMLDLLPFVM